MRTRGLRILVLTAGVVATVGIPGVARAETCTDLPGSTTGATIEAGGERVRVPALSRLQLCTQGGGPIGGIPMVSTEPTGGCWEFCYTVILTGSSGGGDGYVVLRYYADDQPGQVGVPVPGGGPSTERCLVGVGSPQARSDCEVKVSLDRAPVPICVRDLPVCIPPGGSIDEIVDWLLGQWCIDPNNPFVICA